MLKNLEIEWRACSIDEVASGANSGFVLTILLMTWTIVVLKHFFNS
jgi:hypothetical protein